MTESKEQDIVLKFMGEELISEKERGNTSNPCIYRKDGGDLNVLVYRLKKPADGEAPYRICVVSLYDASRGWLARSEDLQGDSKVPVSVVLNGLDEEEGLKSAFTATKVDSSDQGLVLTISSKALGKETKVQIPLLPVTEATALTFSTTFLLRSDLRRVAKEQRKERMEKMGPLGAIFGSL
ncbi:Hypothetical protein POVN_LOCUS594 [uncultured virus]|nr:Hypothetical protein POVN_LOCUS594 [uncultured virus]